MAMCEKLRVCTLRSRVNNPDWQTPSCLLCKYCLFENGVDKVQLLCYNDGSEEPTKSAPTVIDREGYKTGSCGGFEYRTTQIEEAALEAYVG